jgi:hypothetical protein
MQEKVNGVVLMGSFVRLPTMVANRELKKLECMPQQQRIANVVVQLEKVQRTLEELQLDELFVDRSCR